MYIVLQVPTSIQDLVNVNFIVQSASIKKIVTFLYPS